MTEIWQKLKSYIKSNVMPVVVTMAAKRGHTVKYTPSYHSRLQPIKLVWACVKERGGRQYSLPADIIYKCIENSKSEVMRLDKYIRELDTADDANAEHEVESDNADENTSDMEGDLSDYDVDIGDYE
ncbi:hypothetical protein ACHHYP_05443 [Achlya hypogyna]|uniref:Uncharacterized protein n=1 Tax=Achlya hypogyna TaxID=1202772 RepID=A0A1V9ZNN7_ACHHY|nr:hypothetical protein ACHHYP_05443 [Achlya hypogyna]